MAEHDDKQLKVAAPGDQGGDISRQEHTDQNSWANGRAVYWRPESRPSTVAQRDIIQSEEELGRLATTFIATFNERSDLTEDQVDDEIERFDAYERELLGG